MSTDADHGRRLSGEEFDRRITQLYEKLPEELSSDEQRMVRRQELEITIDYRLGCDFPKNRRDLLWEVQERVEKKRARLIFKYLLRRMFSKSLIRSVQNLAGYLVDEYAKVLTPKEMKMYFGEDEVKSPALPVDIDQLKKH